MLDAFDRIVDLLEIGVESFQGLTHLFRISEHAFKQVLFLSIHDPFGAFRFEVLDRVSDLCTSFLSGLKRLLLCVFEECLERVVFAELRLSGSCLLLFLFPPEPFSLIGASFLFGVCDLSGVFARNGSFFLFVVTKGLQHLIVGLRLFSFPFIGGVSAFLHVLLIHSSFGRLVICLLIFGQGLFSRECLVGLFEFLLPFLDLLKLSLVVEINLLELLLEAFIHHLEVGVFNTLACVAGELFDFGHRLGLLFLLFGQLFDVTFGSSSGRFGLVVFLAGHLLVFLYQLIYLPLGFLDILHVDKPVLGHLPL